MLNYQLLQTTMSEANRNIYAFWPRLSNEVIAKNTQNSTGGCKMDPLSFKITGIGVHLLKVGHVIPLRKVASILAAQMLLTFSKFKLWDKIKRYGLGYPNQRVYI